MDKEGHVFATRHCATESEKRRMFTSWRDIVLGRRECVSVGYYHTRNSSIHDDNFKRLKLWRRHNLLERKRRERIVSVEYLELQRSLVVRTESRSATKIYRLQCRILNTLLHCNYRLGQNMKLKDYFQLLVLWFSSRKTVCYLGGREFRTRWRHPQMGRWLAIAKPVMSFVGIIEIWLATCQHMIGWPSSCQTKWF